MPWYKIDILHGPWPRSHTVMYKYYERGWTKKDIFENEVEHFQSPSVTIDIVRSIPKRETNNRI